MLGIPDTNLGLDEFGIPLGGGASGLYRLDVSGNTCWNHRGFLGTIAITCPAADTHRRRQYQHRRHRTTSLATALIAATTS